jgi:hypothetical protein
LLALTARAAEQKKATLKSIVISSNKAQRIQNQNHKQGQSPYDILSTSSPERRSSFTFYFSSLQFVAVNAEAHGRLAETGRSRYFGVARLVQNRRATRTKDAGPEMNQ